MGEWAECHGLQNDICMSISDLYHIGLQLMLSLGDCLELMLLSVGVYTRFLLAMSALVHVCLCSMNHKT